LAGGKKRVYWPRSETGCTMKRFTIFDWFSFIFLVTAALLGLVVASLEDNGAWLPAMEVVGYLVIASIFVNLFRYLRAVSAIE
jgi:hypothetical protein